MSERTTLKRTLLLRLLIPIVILWIIEGALAFVISKRFADRAYDQNLLQTAQQLATQVYFERSVPHLDLSEQAARILTFDATEKVYYAVYDRDARFVYGNRGLPLISLHHPLNEPVFFDASLSGKTVRSVIIVLEREHQRAILQAAATTIVRDQTPYAILAFIVVPQFIIGVLVLMLMDNALDSGLLSLHKLRDNMRERNANDLKPIDMGQDPQEIADLKEAVNTLLQRIRRVIADEQDFIANVTHQLRTPLAGLRTQIELAQRETEPQALSHSLNQMLRSTDQGIHRLNQLLALTRGQARSLSGLQMVECDVVAIARQVTTDMVPQAIRAGIDLGFDASVESLRTLSIADLLAECIANLVDNAIRHCPNNTEVTVSVGQNEQGIVIAVTDNGPGIPRNAYQQVFERYYRLAPQRSDGSGLGLTIVREFVELLGGSVSIAAPTQGKGARIEILLPQSHT